MTETIAQIMKSLENTELKYSTVDAIIVYEIISL
ncbi:Uncharacterised protein [Elizabethkingia anophelis]|uniref:Uncharacterized protein n=1 Tax=Elizabethkingia anophelis TaxID=1117645 RepID=A0A7Z7PVN4_9FLAO|nr:Uncharacterised protein [Elizabethkingia anophelis]